MQSEGMRYSLLALLVPSIAHADQLAATPYLHGNFGDVEFRRGGYGLAIDYLTRRFGIELDAARHHHFYKDAELTSVPNNCMPGVIGPCIDANTDAWLVGANAIGFAPWSTKRWSFYGLAGAGVIHAWIHGAGEFNSSQTHLSASLGAGTTYWIRPWIGVRFEARYLHAFVDDDHPDGGYASDYDFGRITLGVSVRR